MELLKGFWKYLLSIFVLGVSWMFLISGVFVVILSLFLWAFRIGKIFQIYPQMGLNNFLHLARMEIFLAMTLVGFLGVYFLDWRNSRKILKMV